MPKFTRWLSANTVFRSRTPTNEATAQHFTNMAPDYSDQASVVPRGAGHRGGTMNEGGHPKALHAGVGGSRK